MMSEDEARRLHTKLASPVEADRALLQWPDMSGPRILVIAADPSLREFCRDGLPWAGCTIEFADDLTHAIECEVDPDVILIDLIGNGTQAATLARLREYAAAVRSPVIALTDDRSLAEEDSMAGMHLLHRPCPPERLWDALALAIADHDQP